MIPITILTLCAQHGNTLHFFFAPKTVAFPTRPTVTVVKIHERKARNGIGANGIQIFKRYGLHAEIITFQRIFVVMNKIRSAIMRRLVDSGR